MPDYIVQIKDLIQEFKLGEVTVKALRGVSLDLRKGKFYSIIGPSGSGKSTLLNLIGGLDTFISGKIIVNGEELSKMSENQLAKYRLRHVGFVFQFFNLIPTLTALKNVELPLIFSRVQPGERNKMAKSVLKKVGLGGRMNHRPTELSGGEQQRVSLARALINNPEIILADEPTGNLDTNTGREIMKLIADLNQVDGKTIILVTHDQEVSHYAYQIINLRDGLIENVENNRELKGG